MVSKRREFVLWMMVVYALRANLSLPGDMKLVVNGMYSLPPSFLKGRLICCLESVVVVSLAVIL